MLDSLVKQQLRHYTLGTHTFALYQKKKKIVVGPSFCVMWFVTYFLWCCRYNIERQAAAYYIRNVFGKFQKQVIASTGFVINQDAEY